MTTDRDALPENLRDYVERVERSLESAGVEPLARHGILRDLEGMRGLNESAGIAIPRS